MLFRNAVFGRHDVFDGFLDVPYLKSIGKLSLGEIGRIEEGSFFSLDYTLAKRVEEKFELEGAAIALLTRPDDTCNYSLFYCLKDISFYRKPFSVETIFVLISLTMWLNYIQPLDSKIRDWKIMAETAVKLMSLPICSTRRGYDYISVAETVLYDLRKEKFIHENMLYPCNHIFYVL